MQIVEPKTDWSSVEPLKVLGEFEDEADVILHATGILNRWDYPEIPGLKDFKGRVIHSAGWPDDYSTPESWRGQNVVVIGSGATSIQVVPTMQVKKVSPFVGLRAKEINLASCQSHGCLCQNTGLVCSDIRQLWEQPSM